MNIPRTGSGFNVFYDYVHTNLNGAEVFAEILMFLIRQQFITSVFNGK